MSNMPSPKSLIAIISLGAVLGAAKYPLATRAFNVATVPSSTSLWQRSSSSRRRWRFA